jgi:hypothetical protein
MELTASVTNLNDGTIARATGGTFQVQPPIVNLVGNPATGSAGFLVFGKRAKVPLFVRNDGNVVTTSAPATFGIIVSSTVDGTKPVYETSVATKVKVNPGATKPVKLSVTFPTGAFPAGNYFMILKPTVDLNQTNGQTLATLSFGIS